MMKDITHWNDQPRFLEGGIALFEYIKLKDAMSAQIIVCHGTYFLTVGNLFGSQTVAGSLPDIGKLVSYLSLDERSAQVYPGDYNLTPVDDDYLSKHLSEFEQKPEESLR